MPTENTKLDIKFTDCVDSVRYEIEDALARFPVHKHAFLFQVRLLLESLEKREGVTCKSSD